MVDRPGVILVLQTTQRGLLSGQARRAGEVDTLLDMICGGQ
jgi:hypothetical protein